VRSRGSRRPVILRDVRSTRTAHAVRSVDRAAGDPVALAGAIRADIRALDPHARIVEVISLEQLITRSIASRRYDAALPTLFAGAALAATGIFGTMSELVVQRLEIGIRIAPVLTLVLRMIVGRAVTLATGGIILGLAIALAVRAINLRPGEV